MNINQKLRILAEIADMVEEGHSLERCIIEKTNLNILDLLDSKTMWEKLNNIFDDCYAFKAILRLLAHVDRNRTHIMRMYRKLLVASQTELKLREKQQQLTDRTSIRVLLLSMILGLAAGTLLGLFITIPFFSAEQSLQQILLLTMFTLTISTILSIKKISLLLHTVAYLEPKKKKNFAKSILLFLLMFALSLTIILLIMLI